MKKLLLFTLALIGTMSAWGVDVIQNVRTSTKYSSISTAISQAQADDELIFLCDKDMGSGGVTISKRIKLNLNGKTITGLGNTSEQNYIFVVSNGIAADGDKKVEIYGGTINPSKDNFAIYSYSPIYIHDIDVTATSAKDNSAIMIKAWDSYVKDCNITTNSGCGGLFVSYNTNYNPAKLGNMTVENCTVDVKDYSCYNSGCVMASRGSSATIESGSYTSKGSCVSNTTSGGTLTIKGGIYICTGTRPYIYSSTSGDNNYTGAICCEQNGKYTIKGGIFSGYLYERTKSTSLNITKGVFDKNSIVTGEGQNPSDVTFTQTYYTADNIYFIDYKAYTGSSIDDVKPYADYAAAIDDGQTTFNLCATNTISANTTLSGVAITQKGNADAFEVTGGTLTVQGTTTITESDGNNAINVNGGTLVVEEGEDNVLIGQLAKTNGTISLAGGKYTQDEIPADYIKAGYEAETEGGKIVVKKKVAPTKYEREVTEGNWGTMCLAYATSSYTGAKFYRVVGKSDDQLQLTVELVEGQLTAGKPYIFCATANKIVCNYTGDAAAAGSDNGLIGTIDGINWSGDAAVSDEYTGLNDMYMLSSNEFVKAGTGSALRPNRAYLDLSQVFNENSSAPGRRITLNIAGTNTTTNIDAISAESAQAQKVMLNGKLFIRRGAQLFDAQGALVK